MRVTIVLVLIVITSTVLNAQNLILNGSFENNSATGSMTGLTSDWPNYVADSWEIDGGTMDLVTTYTCDDPYDGNWFVTTCSSCGTWPYIAFSFKLSAPVVAGGQYTISFYDEFCLNSSAVDIGLSDDSTLLGTVVHTFPAPLTSTWTLQTYTFQAPTAAKYLTVNVGYLGGTGLIALDDFTLEGSPTAIEECPENHLSIFPNPANDDFQISFYSSNTSTAILELKNIEGKVKLQREISISAGTNKISIGDLRLEKGIYFIVLCGRNVSYQGKVTLE